MKFLYKKVDRTVCRSNGHCTMLVDRQTTKTHYDSISNNSKGLALTVHEKNLNCAEQPKPCWLTKKIYRSMMYIKRNITYYIDFAVLSSLPKL